MEGYSFVFQNHEYYPVGEDCWETQLIYYNVVWLLRTTQVTYNFEQPYKIMFSQYRLLCKLYNVTVIAGRTLNKIWK